ncbi:hypothetical protein JKF63_07587 [Porcisia hertigi]|uniref:Ribosome biogenesis protein SLX9 n=1 Tax=Porcisia hertigi TaxID=2761500 RepID=A0A836LM58_9TRYP|nr:hypothetical protein JKF63_07587 [Porcisia hertigi]
MAGGKSAKRVKLRTKIDRRQQAEHATSEQVPLSNVLSSSPSSASAGGTTAASLAAQSPTEADRQVALHIRDALRQRHGRTGRAPVAMRLKEAVGRRTTNQVKDGPKRRLGKSAKKETASSQHPVGALRRRLTVPHRTAAEKRMTVAQEELQLFQKVQTVSAYMADPFAAVMQHLSSTMDALQPQTPDVGLAERTSGAGRRR